MERMKTTIVAGAMVAGLALAVLPLAGCGPRGRVKDDNEGDLVGSRKAGAETYNRLVNETTKKLLGDIERKPAPGKKLVIAMLPIDNEGAEELGDIRAATYESAAQVVFDSGLFTMLDKDYIDTVVKKVGMRPKDLFLQEGIEKFLSVLRKDGKDPNYLLLTNYTTLSTGGVGGTSQRDYQMTMRLVDSGSGETVARKTTKVRKEYDD
jgi:hypothetical protein